MFKINLFFIQFIIFFLNYNISYGSSNIQNTIDVAYSNNKIIIKSNVIFKVNKIFALNDPARVVLDLNQNNNFIVKELKNPSIVRKSQNKESTRIVFDINKLIGQISSIKLNSNILSNNAIEINYSLIENSKKLPKINEIKETNNGHVFHKDISLFNSLLGRVIKKDNTIQPKYNFTVAIDAGHGGYDPGSLVGSFKIPEKTITLMYAKLLENKLNNLGIKTLMIRDSDIYVPTESRIPLAIKKRADFFVSFHADSAPNKNAKGLTIYTLSNIDDASKIDKLGKRDYLPTTLHQYLRDETILDTILELMYDIITPKTQEIAKHILNNIKTEKLCYICKHRQKSLAVLRTIAMPSILIEIGYLSNKDDELKIISAHYADKLTQIIANSIHSMISVKNDTFSSILQN